MTVKNGGTWREATAIHYFYENFYGNSRGSIASRSNAARSLYQSASEVTVFREQKHVPNLRNFWKILESFISLVNIAMAIRNRFSLHFSNVRVLSQLCPNARLR